MGDIQETIYNMILKRNNFYYKNLRFMIIVWLIGIVSFICLFIASYYAASGHKEASYIPVNLDGTVIKQENLQSRFSDQLELTDEYVISWVQSTIPRVYNFDFLGMSASYRNMVGLFTPSGLKKYQDQIVNKAKIKATIEAEKYSVQAHGCGDSSTKILSTGVVPVENYPVFTWFLEMPIVIRQSSSDKAISSKATLNVRVQRVPRLTSANGISIYSFVIQDQESYAGDKPAKELCQLFYKIGEDTNKNTNNDANNT